MNIFKIDLMTVLFVVVLIGVIVTMTTQANDHTVSSVSMTNVSTHAMVGTYTVKY